MFNIILNQLKETKELVAMYNNKYDSSAFFVGVIIDTDEYYTQLSTVSPSALYDGHVVIKNEDIHKIELRSRYIKKIDFLLKDNKVKFDFSCCNKKDSSLLLSILKYCENNSIVVTISLDYDDNNHTGFINIMDDDICSISVLDEYGTDDGLVYFSINTISKLVFDGMYEKQTKKYWNSL